VNRVDLIGLGLNVNIDPNKAPPASLRQRLTSLSSTSGTTHDRTDVLIALAGHLGQMLHRRTAHPFQGLLREYDAHHALVGKNVSVMLAPDLPQVTGRCEGIDDTGRLLVRQRKQSLHRVIAGQIISWGRVEGQS
jgi:biotin-(acetyl-CoA carboxylase) ligase